MKNFYNHLFFLVILSFVSFAQIPTDSLVAYYPFSGNANDLSGKGNNGTVTGATLITDRFDNTNSAYSFNGSTSCVILPTNLNGSLLNLSKFSFSGWIRQTGSNVGSSIFNNWSGQGTGVGTPYGITISCTNKITISVCAGQGNQFKDSMILNRWYHITVTFDGNQSTRINRLKVYIDGTQSTMEDTSAQTIPTQLGSVATYTSIGNRNMNGEWKSAFFNGQIDDIRIYNKVLTQQEITALKNESPASPNNPPGFISTPDTLATEDLAWSYAITAVDVDVGDVVTYSLRTPPQGMSLSGSTVSWTPANAQVGSNIIIIRATDSHGAFSDQTFRVRVANVNDAPGITSLAPTAAVQGQLFQYQAQASDPDAGDALTWQLTTKPTGMTISSSGLVSWTPTQEQIGSNAVVVSVNDVANVSAQQSFSIIVTNVNDAPVITNPTSQNATEDIPFSLQLAATDPDANQVFWFVVSGPDSLKVNLNTGLVAWTPKQNVAGTTVTVKIRATDAVLSDTTTFTISVAAVNDPPVITSILPTQFKTDTLYSIPLMATDEEDDPVTWSIIRKPATMSIIANNLVWAPTITGIDTITIIASDGTGFDTLSQAVQVQNSTGIKFHSRAALPSTFELKSIRNATGTISVMAGLPKSANFGSISLFSVSGKKIAEKNISGSGWHSVTFGSMPKGSYLLRMNAGGKSFVERVVN